ncbi:4-hydroxythreonine-4-phosphate dehydrogenase [Raphidocelis subcapitata]|uniref:4-hydroxythreonine-4-phosphate dehydrogenase n=1 Tax=Raphidocelis subcapitata TaxID=307507 RepID=A0A2V0NUV0_9CHLO|nr:4-hydroxythreonine-4-phosphate dehydrogenase [Raphidocelis subcapitata]|eukprot:GBF91418.1 4-hydroxythreonine-4-phosphate dehydrogenase [Raphidocelis subcapitata]
MIFSPQTHQPARCRRGPLRVRAAAAAPRRPRPRIALTLGDPAGVGPEVALKIAADPDIAAACDLTLFGSEQLLRRAHAELRLCLAAHRAGAGWLPDMESLSLADVALPGWVAPGVVPHLATNASGEASFRFLEAAVTAAMAGDFDAVVTGPVSKAAWHAAGHRYPGQTEYLAERAGAAAGSYGMMFVARSPSSGWQCNLLLATAHVPLAEVPKSITRGLLDRKLALLMETLPKDLGYPRDKVHIAVAGLNPHSGEGGQMGREEEELIGPWLEAQRAAHPHAWLEGPVPPDTMWVRPGRAFRGGPRDVEQLQPADAYLAMYHDQGLAPLKLMAFDQAVNFTAGLPFVRTSPDHGTAFDLDGGLADANSTKEAVLLACRVAEQRRRHAEAAGGGPGAAAGAAAGRGAPAAAAG